MKAIKFLSNGHALCLFAGGINSPFQYQDIPSAHGQLPLLAGWLTSAERGPVLPGQAVLGSSPFHYVTIRYNVEARGSRYMVTNYDESGTFLTRDFIGKDDVLPLFKNIYAD